MKSLLYKGLTVSLLGLFLAGTLPLQARASTPTLAVNNDGSNQLRIEVRFADAFAKVDLYQRPRSTTLWTVYVNIGQTDGSGFFSTTGMYGNAGEVSDYYVVVNGQQSSTVQAGSGGGCTYNCGGNQITFSVQNVNLNIGQSQNVSIYGSTGNFYISQNTNASIVSASLSGNSLFLNANQNGSSIITVCGSSTAQCGSLYVTVGGSSGSGQITFSQSFVSVSIGQSQSVSIYNSGFNTAYYISSNSNPSIVSASISGSNVNVYGQNSGTSSISVCGSNSSMCGTITVTVGGGTSGQISFSQSNVTIGVNQSAQVSIFSSYSGYYISSNSNPNVVSATVSGSTLNLYASNFGNSTIQVCSSGGQYCASMYVTVSGSGGQNTISFSQNNVVLSQGQSLQVSVYSNNYNSSFYISNNEYPNIVGANLAGSTLTLFGSSYGSSRVTVCASGVSGCGSLYVTVSGGGVYNQLSLSQSNVNLNVGQSNTVTVYNGSNNNLYISQNSSPNVVSATLSNYLVTLYGINPGSATIYICSYNQSGCASLYVSVGGSSNGNNGSLTLVTTQLPQITVGQYYNYQLQATGGQPPYTYSMYSGNLPAGLSLSASGLISGVAQSTATAGASIKITDTYSRIVYVPVTFSGTTSTGGLNFPGGVQGTQTYHSGSLISEYGTVSIVYNGTKSAFTNLAAFRGLGYSLSQVTEVGNSGLPDSGYQIRSSASAHPWGSWIKSGRTLYFVHEQGLIPVPSREVFYANGGSYSAVVSANRWDLRKAYLPTMEYNDSRIY